MNNISWRLIRAFLSVAEHGSFTAAAEAQGLSKANMSQQVSELEASLGVQLIHRTTRKLRLTEIGEGYYERCTKAMRHLDSAADWASQSKAELRGTIRMNAVGGPIGEDVLAPLLIEFQKEHPNVQLQLDFSSIRVDLIEDHYDLVLRMGELPDSTLIGRKLTTLTTRYVASPDFLALHDPIKKPEDMIGLPLIYGSVNHWIFKQGNKQRIIHAEGGIKLISGRAMRHAALAGLGITRTADLYIKRDLQAGRLVELLPDWAEETPLSLICPPTRHQLARVRALMDHLQAHFKARYDAMMEQGL